MIANAFFVFMCLPLSVSVYLLEGSISKSLLHLYSSLYFSPNLLFPASLTFGVFQRQRMVITVLENIKAPEESTEVLNSREKEDVEKVRCIMRIYSDLLGIVDEISLCYGFSMLLVTAVVFLYTLMTNFVMYKEFNSTGTFTGRVALMYVVFYTILFNTTLLVCSMTEVKVSLKEIEETENNLNFLEL